MSFECCKQGSFHKGIPTGTETKLGNLNTYVTGDANSSAAILIIADIFGWNLNNTRVLADKYAKGIGARVYLVDFLENEPVDPKVMAGAKFDIGNYLSRHPPRDVPFPIASQAIRDIRTIQPSVKKIGAIGFCWGAPSVLYLGSSLVEKDVKVDAIAFAHPSVVLTSDFETINVPSLFLCAEIDHQLDDEKREKAIKITNQVAKDKNLLIKWVYYPNTTHGFAIRGDEQDAHTAKAMQDAANQAILHFRAELLV